ncbi:methyltransferase [Alkalimonas sp. MEB108]|uniref:tRNA1(Val) (adenine(37)-N6)-methyltransferase n=1 Tax=Alkalimonas cellulosilytica TaxID=3058395 RepID=A0ABU7J8M7_9GAMM|nr:methyltransferase [Alkalimonas sp. MEB108]MEE2002734.1 methyltransferase [Alkalimonas sp. MEB108]
MAAGFQCKQFFIGHQHCAMKVGTDALLLGAWARIPASGNLLDIGCGSGILSLMLAQRTEGRRPITALDLDAGAVQQSRSNVAASPWPATIQVLEQDILTYQPAERYSLLLCNPPYFHQALPARDPARQLARHSDSLPWPHLLQHAAQLACDDADFALVIPDASATMLLQAGAEAGWQLKRWCRVQPSPQKAVRRALLQLSRQPAVPEHSQLCIQQHDGQYSEAYRQLLKDFYLKF